jgi:hypothetical protein
MLFHARLSYYIVLKNLLKNFRCSELERSKKSINECLSVCCLLHCQLVLEMNASLFRNEWMNECLSVCCLLHCQLVLDMNAALFRNEWMNAYNASLSALPIHLFMIECLFVCISIDLFMIVCAPYLLLLFRMQFFSALNILLFVFLSCFTCIYSLIYSMIFCLNWLLDLQLWKCLHPEYLLSVVCQTVSLLARLFHCLPDCFTVCKTVSVFAILFRCLFSFALSFFTA